MTKKVITLLKCFYIKGKDKTLELFTQLNTKKKKSLFLLPNYHRKVTYIDDFLNVNPVGKVLE